MILVTAPDLDRFYIETDSIPHAKVHVRKTRSCNLENVRYKHVQPNHAQFFRSVEGFNAEIPASVSRLADGGGA